MWRTRIRFNTSYTHVSLNGGLKIFMLRNESLRQHMETFSNTKWQKNVLPELLVLDR